MRWFVRGVLALGLSLQTFAQSGDARESRAEEEDARCLALTLYWEARSEGRRGMVPVAWVVLNRRDSARFAGSICQVTRDGGETSPCQFSFWCDGRSDQPTDGRDWALARSIAQEMLSRPPADPTRGALYFHTVDVSPAWAKERQRTVRIGRHIYYR
jgi:spore germination cell wall hydrolase CwlJ-like protein